MTALICPKCKNGIMKWAEDLKDGSMEELETTDLICEACGERYKGMADWIKATDKK